MNAHIRDTMARVEELGRAFELQRHNYDLLCAAVMGEGTLAGSPDPIAVAQLWRSEVKRLREEVTRLKDWQNRGEYAERLLAELNKPAVVARLVDGTGSPE